MTATDAHAAALAALAGGAAPDPADVAAAGPTLTGLEYGDGPAERVVLFDRFSFVDSTGIYQVAARGDVVHLTDEAAKRGDELEATAAAGKLDDPLDVDVDLLTLGDPPATMYDPTRNVEYAAVYVNGHTDELDAIRELEEGREQPRSTVLDAIDRIEARMAERDEAAAMTADDDDDGA